MRSSRQRNQATANETMKAFFFVWSRSFLQTVKISNSFPAIVRPGSCSCWITGTKIEDPKTRVYYLYMQAFLANYHWTSRFHNNIHNNIHLTSDGQKGTSRQGSSSQFVRFTGSLNENDNPTKRLKTFKFEVPWPNCRYFIQNNRHLFATMYILQYLHSNDIINQQV